MIPKLIGPEQGGFVPGRQMGDHVLLASELQHLIWNAYDAKAGAMMKIDLQKAFDKLSWSFISESLRTLGFDEIWINWILALIEKPLFGIKINGKVEHWIEGKSGLRQGCPLSPSLFILCSEILSRQEETFGNIQGMRLSALSTPVTHLFYALFFSHASVDHCRRLMSIIQEFCDLSGQCINHNKSIVMLSRRTKDTKRAEMLLTLGLPENREIGKYLGVPLVTSRIGPEHFADLQARILARIGGWRNRLLSFAGKLCLINYALYPMLHHILGHSVVPAYILSWIDCQVRGFLWGHDPNIWKWHHVGWSTLCQARALGGAGLLDLRRAKRPFKFLLPKPGSGLPSFGKGILLIHGLIIVSVIPLLVYGNA